MRYLVHVRLRERKSTHRIDADSEAEAARLLLPRLSPKDREEVVIDAIEPDPTALHVNEAFGTFLNDSHD
ncbi:MAG: hypothetical protein JXK05_00900 [Campylobacterales bacterium]|nr:hypothetical protein [Campylobacterales bacterium]